MLGVVVTERIFLRFPHMPEGELAKLRSSVVSAASLAAVGADLEVGAVMRLGKGEESSGGRAKPSILADALEALIGAVFLDGGLDAARIVVLRLLADQIEANAEDGPGWSDHKTQLQELSARRFDQPPVYDVRDEGPDHQKRFFATVLVGGVRRGRGEGRTKKQAEQAAARDACERLWAEVDQADQGDQADQADQADQVDQVDQADQGDGAGAPVGAVGGRLGGSTAPNVPARVGAAGHDDGGAPGGTPLPPTLRRSGAGDA